MIASTMVLNGHLIQEGVKFFWWVVDGPPPKVTVSHPLHGTRTSLFDGDPVRAARKLAKEILAES